MSIQFGATVFFNKPDEFPVIQKVAKQFPFIKYVEFRGEHPFLIPDYTPPETMRFYKEWLVKTGLKSTVHTTMYDINLATLNPWLRNANIACYKKYIEAAAFLGSEVIVVHGGELYKEFAESPRKAEFIELAEKHLTESLYELAEYGRERGVKVALENAPPEGYLLLVRDPETHLRMINKVNHPNLGALLDFAHAFLNKLDLKDYLEKIKPHLMEIHAHNNFGKKDEHLGLSKGKIDYAGLLSHPGVHNVPFIMEIKSYEEVMDTLTWLTKKLGY